MTHPDDDLDDPRLSRLYRELPDEQPSSATDDAIRAAARRAVKAGPGRRPSPWALGRLAATAATLLLGVALTVHWQAREPAALREAVSPSPPTAHQDVPGGDAATAAAMMDEAPAAPSREAVTGQAASSQPAEAPPAVTARAPARRNSAASAPAPDSPEATPETLRSAIAAAPEAPAPVSPAAEAEAPAAEREARDERAEANRYAARAREERAPASADVAARRAAKSTAPAAALQLRGAAADYRTAMAAGRTEEALAALPAPDSYALALDRDLIEAALSMTSPPGCSRHPGTPAPGEAVLCEALSRRAAGQSLPRRWREDAAAALQGEHAYRQPAVEQAFGLPPSR